MRLHSLLVAAAISTTLMAHTSKERPFYYLGPLYGGTQHIIDYILPKWSEVVKLDSLMIRVNGEA